MSRVVIAGFLAGLAFIAGILVEHARMRQPDGWRTLVVPDLPADRKIVLEWEGHRAWSTDGGHTWTLVPPR